MKPLSVNSLPAGAEPPKERRNEEPMKTSDFYYELPENLIAQTPLQKRDTSRLMLLDADSGCIAHKSFSDLPLVLKPGDCLVLNNSRVLPARLIGRRKTGGAVELLLLTDKGDGVWECLTRPGRKCGPGIELVFGDGILTAQVLDVLPGGNRLIQFQYAGIFLELLDQLGKVPLPPYIKEELGDPERYQTVYSKQIGSAAAPTAGLHFTNELLGTLKNNGIELCFLTLHVGLGTFRPVKTLHIEEHEMHAEYCSISQETAHTVSKAKEDGRRIIACGTTSCRALEAACNADGTLTQQSGWINIFIYPGYRFRCIDGLLTNFHLPESTLIMLVSALAGRSHVMNAYETAVKEKYRFFSFGDAMLIL
jgi:S-adenosylmethionine:tRNA ribosyltransferase-isomerase